MENRCLINFKWLCASNKIFEFLQKNKNKINSIVKKLKSVNK